MRLGYLLLMVGAAILAGRFVVEVDFADYVVVSAGIAVFLMLPSFYLISRFGKRVVFLPSVIAVVFMTLATVTVPFSWFLGYLNPWPELRDQEVLVVGVGAILLVVLGVGIVIGWRRNVLLDRSPPVTYQDRQVRRALILSTIVGLVSLHMVLRRVGGANTALESLDVRRTFFAGLGPLIGLAFSPGLALTYFASVPNRHRSRLTVLLAVVAGGAFLTAVFFTGEKGNALALALLIMVAVGRRATKVRLLPVFILLLSAIPLSTLYHYEIRQERATGTAEGTIDSSSLSGLVASTWSPVATSGLDYLRTLAKVLPNATPFALRIDPLLKAPATAVPRELWPSKPEGAALQFSREHYPAEWEQGTGIPPAFAAELIWEFGYIGGPLMFLLTGVAIGRIDSRLTKSRHLLAPGLHGIFAVSIYVLLKTGSDSGFREFFFLLLPLLLVHVVVITGRRPSSEKLPPRGNASLSSRSYPGTWLPELAS
jgi:hypothetical protein